MRLAPGHSLTALLPASAPGEASRSAQRLSRSLGQLSTGRRVQRAADDAAGLGVSVRLSARARGLAVAARAAVAAQGILAVAEAGLDQQTTLLQRLRALAVGAASGSASAESRAAAQDEATALLAELNRVAQSADHNGLKTLATTGLPATTLPRVDVDFHIDMSGSMVGEVNRVRSAVADFAQTLTDAGFDARFGLNEMGGDTDDAVRRTTPVTDLAGFTSALNDFDTGGSNAMDIHSSLLEAVGLRATVGRDEPDEAGFRAEAEGKHIIVVTDTFRERTDLAPATTAAGVRAQMEAIGVGVHVIAPSRFFPLFYNNLYTNTADAPGSLHNIGDSTGSGIPTAMRSIAELLARSIEAEPRAAAVQVGADAGAGMALPVPTLHDVSAMGLLSLDLSTVEGARSALGLTDAALAGLGSLRAQVGAVDARLDRAAALAAAHGALFAGAAAQITDADVAQAAVELTRAQLRRDATVTAMAQARRLSRGAVEALLG
jgi:flagellin